MWSGAIPSSDGSGPHYSYYVSKARANTDEILAGFMITNASFSRSSFKIKTRKASSNNETQLRHFLKLSQTFPRGLM